MYDLETHKTDRARPYIMTFFRLSKLAGRYNRNLTPHEIENCKKDTLVFAGDNCVNNAFDFLSKFNAEEQKTINIKIVDYNLQLHGHNVSRFVTRITLNSIPRDKYFVDNTNNGKGIIYVRFFNGYLDNNKKQIFQYLIFRCGMTHFNYSLKTLGRTFKLEEELLKTEMNHDEINGDDYKDKKDIWVDYVEK